MQASKQSIDLVKNKTNLLDDILRWALSFGRLLVIVVEIVAFSAFIWRFSLDRQLIDLNDKIKQEQAIIVVMKPKEIEYRNLQQRLATIKQIDIKGNKTYQILNDIIAFTPAEITYNSISIDNDEVKIDTNIQSISSLTAFVNSLKEYPGVLSVNISSIQNRSQTNSVNVIIDVKLKKGSNEISL
jgi:Tfp pilus assembly protein PilN